MNTKMFKKRENTKLAVASFITGHPKAVVYGVGFAVTLAVLPFLVQVHDANAYWWWRWHGPFITLHRHITFPWLLPPGYGNMNTQSVGTQYNNDNNNNQPLDSNANTQASNPNQQSNNDGNTAQSQLAQNLMAQDMSNLMPGGIWNHYNP